MAASSASIDFSVLPNPLSVEIISSKPAVKYRTKITAAIMNRGDLPIRDVKVYLELPDDLSGKIEPLKIKILKPHSSKQTIWLVTGATPGDYKVTVRAEGILDGINQLIAAETTISITFYGKSARIFSFFQNWTAFTMTQRLRLWGHILNYDSTVFFTKFLNSFTEIKISTVYHKQIWGQLFNYQFYKKLIISLRLFPENR